MHLAVSIERSARLQTGIVAVALVCYRLGFAMFPPSALGINDEVFYVHQAQAFAEGQIADSIDDPISGKPRRILPSTYPVGTSLLQAPFVRVGGWRAAPLVSALSLTAAVLALVRWIDLAGGPPLAALLFFGFLPTLVLGRTAMSDVPGALVVTLGLWLFWRDQESTPGARHSRWPAFLAGLFAGLSLLFRETDALLFVPFVAGAVLRRRPRAALLVAGGVVGVTARLVSAWLIYGDPLFYRDPGYGLSVAAVAQNAPLYLFALVVMIPAGLPAALGYRGPWRTELVVATLLYVGFFLAYSFSGLESGGIRRLVVGPRFFIPLAPLLAVAAARTLPPWIARAGRWGRGGVAFYAATIVAAAFGVHVVHGRWSLAQARLARAIHEATRPDEIVVTNLLSTGKLFPEAESERPRLELAQLRSEDVPRMLARGRKVALAVFDRTDTPFFRERTAEDQRLLARVKGLCHLTLRYDGAASASDRLRIWGV
ncbi:MAG: hypothetical protein ACTHM9_15645, partial [Gemmatimonadales bacterium]